MFSIYELVQNLFRLFTHLYLFINPFKQAQLSFKGFRPEPLGKRGEELPNRGLWGWKISLSIASWLELGAARLRAAREPRASQVEPIFWARWSSEPFYANCDELINLQNHNELLIHLLVFDDRYMTL